MTDEKPKTPTLGQVFGSVVAAFIGVQSSVKHERDFVHGKPSQYIIIGLGVTIGFVLIVWGVVEVVMSVAGV